MTPDPPGVASVTATIQGILEAVRLARGEPADGSLPTLRHPAAPLGRAMDSSRDPAALDLPARGSRAWSYTVLRGSMR